MKRNLPDPTIASTIAHLRRLKDASPGGTDGRTDPLMTLATKLQAAAYGLDSANAVVGVGLTADQVELLRDAHLDPEVTKALARVGVSLPDGALHVASAEQITGWTNLIDGTVFEQVVTDAANNGHIALPNSADHVVLAGRVQEGWDLDLMRGDEVVGHAQVKFSSTDHSILLHVHNHSDIPIVIANHEAAAAAAQSGVPVIDSHIAYGPIHDAAHQEVADHIGLIHFLHEWVPGAALIVIVAMAGSRRHHGESRHAVAAWAKEQAATAGVANAVATIASIATGHELVRIPTALLTRFWIGRADVSGAAQRRAKVTRENLRRRIGFEPKVAL